MICKVSAPVSFPAGAAKFHPFVVGDQPDNACTFYYLCPCSKCHMSNPAPIHYCVFLFFFWKLFCPFVFHSTSCRRCNTACFYHTLLVVLLFIITVVNLQTASSIIRLLSSFASLTLKYNLNFPPTFTDHAQPEPEKIIKLCTTMCVCL